jgi:hypothetical protein
MKLCIDCADEIPEDRLRLAQSTMRCVSCQEIHEIGWYEKQIRPSELKSKNIENTKEKNLLKKPTKSPINFFTCISCNYKKNQFIDRPCAWCGVSGQILDQNHSPIKDINDINDIILHRSNSGTKKILQDFTLIN